MPAKKRIPLDDLKANTYYDAPLWLDDQFLLLSTDTPVTEQLIARLKTWGYRGIWTEGSLVSGGTPATASAVSVSGAVLNNDAKEAEGRRIARQFFINLAAFTRKVYDTFSRDGYLDMNAITETVKEAIQMIRDYRSYILRLPDLRADGIDYLFTHSARSTVIALTVGDALKQPNHKLIELGIASILHEIGMMQIPRQIFDKSTELSEPERKVINTHPSRGMKMLQDFSRDNSNPLAQDILMGVWQHHERSNGSGYPQGLSGESITLFGRIIAVACAYDAQISNRPWRDAMDGFRGMLLMLREMKNNLFDDKVVTALLNSISIYPLGNFVRLKNGAIGIVVDIGDDPRYPVVKLHLDENLHMFKEQPIVQTREDDGLSVDGVLSDQEIKDFVSRDLLPR